MMLFFIIISIGIQNQMLAAQLDRNEGLARQVATLINDEAVLASKVNPGYTRGFTLPALVDGSPYTLSLYGDEDLLVSFRGEDYLYFLDAPLRNQTPLRPGTVIIAN
ncbi:hypothetical protein JXA12_01245 [Candidatus Woesearchaeota archaeon]|nr:hypothetical protein [Candidatus Woesearchaeota archaeon]